MALSTTELELQTTEYLPAREVMTSMGGHHGHGGPSQADINHYEGPEGNTYAGGILNGLNVQGVASDLEVQDVQVGLVNVMVHDVNDAIDLFTANADELNNITD